jgi:hypothetical protein
MRTKLLAAMASVALAGTAHAAVTPDEEALVRCQVDLDVAYELMVPIEEGQTEKDALAAADSEFVGIAMGLRAMSQEISERLIRWTHHTGVDSERLGVVEKAEEDEIVAMFEAAHTDAQFEAVMDQVLDRVDACGERFPDLIEAV